MSRQAILNEQLSNSYVDIVGVGLNKANGRNPSVVFLHHDSVTQVEYKSLKTVQDNQPYNSLEITLAKQSTNIFFNVFPTFFFDKIKEITIRSKDENEVFLTLDFSESNLGEFKDLRIKLSKNVSLIKYNTTSTIDCLNLSDVNKKFDAIPADVQQRKIISNSPASLFSSHINIQTSQGEEVNNALTL